MSKLRIIITLFLTALLLAACSGNTTSASNVTSNSATLNAQGKCTTSCHFWTRYRVHGTMGWTDAPTTHNGPVGTVSSTTPFHIDVTGLKPSTQYDYQACGDDTNNGTFESGCAGPDGTSSTYDTFTTLAGTAGASMSSTPVIPSSETPSGGWKLEFADAFGATIGNGSGQDNTFYGNRRTSGATCGPEKGDNTNEMENFTCAQTTENPSTGLDLRCSYGAPSGWVSNGGSAVNYNCGAVTSNGASMPAGYNGFLMKDPYGSGRSVVWQINTQFPPNYQSDPGFWGTGPYSPAPNNGDENDWFEGWGWNGKTGCINGDSCAITWAGANMTLPTVSVGGGGGQRNIYGVNTASGLGFDPSQAYHTYDLLYRGDNSIQAYVDGNRVTWNSCSCTTFTPSSHIAESLSIILSFAMRGGFTDSKGNVIPDPVPTFNTPGQYHDWFVRSVGVWENASANDVGASQSNGSTTFPLIAPGTTVH